MDYSEGSRSALEYAAGLARRMGACLDVLHVWECMPKPPAGIRIRTGDGESRLLTDVVHENAEREMRAFLSGANLPDDLRIQHSIQSGEPSRRILDAAAAGEYTLIVMGTQGRGALTHFVLGSVAERVLRLSSVPVIVVPSKAADALKP